MTNIGTLTQQLLRELHLDAATAGTQASNDCKKELIDAMNYFETEAYWFMRRRITINLAIDEHEYDLPQDFMGITSAVFYVPTSTSPLIKWELIKESLTYVHSTLSTGTEWETTINHGNPKFYAVDPSTRKLLIVPRPSTGVDAVEFEYTIGGANPWYEYASSTWSFYEPGSTTTMADTYTNAWIEGAPKLLLHRAAEQLLTGTYGGSEAAMAKASMYEKKYVQALGTLRAKHTRQLGGYTITRDL